jgi:methyl-accepting chemotaxis protein
MRLKPKLIGAFLCVATICAVLGVVALVLSGQYVEMSEEAMLCADTRISLTEREVDHLNWAAEVRDLFLEEHESLDVQMDDHQCKLGKFLYGQNFEALSAKYPEVAQRLDAMKVPHKRLHDSAHEINELWLSAKNGKAEDREAALTVFQTDTVKALETVQGGLHEANTELLAIEKEIEKEQVEQSEFQRTAIVVCIVLSVLAALALGYWIARGIAGPATKALGMAESIKAGDLSQRLRIDTRDEIGKMSTALDAMADELENKAQMAESIAEGDLSVDVPLASDRDRLGKALKTMVGNLNRILAQIRDAAVQVASGANQISDASQALSQGATEQAASLQQITSSMTQMGAQINTSAENAGQANQLAGTARTSADEGSSRMKEMVTAMGEINEASRSISNIIKVIDDIAFQTNLLALNAAVEAARAGRHGKGFAVVAEEVRNLAARSAKAARETAQLIDGSVKKVENGTEIADRTSEALTEIVEGVTKVSDLVGDIASASNEQAQGTAQVNQGLTQIDTVTQQNTASAEETAASSEELSAQARELQQVLQSFKLNENDDSPPQAAEPVETGQDD